MIYIYYIYIQVNLSSDTEENCSAEKLFTPLATCGLKIVRIVPWCSNSCQHAWQMQRPTALWD